jgi:hypothetical protein
VKGTTDYVTVIPFRLLDKRANPKNGSLLAILAQEIDMNNTISPITGWLPIQPAMVKRTWSMRQRTCWQAMTVGTQRVLALTHQGIEPLNVSVVPESDGHYMVTITYMDAA